MLSGNAVTKQPQNPLRDFKVFISDIFRKPPVLLPLVALFHVLWFMVMLWSVITAYSAGTAENAGWMLLYTIFWIGVSDLRKWGAIGYILLTVVSILVWYVPYLDGKSSSHVSPMFLVDIVFSFFALVYYKKFR